MTKHTPIIEGDEHALADADKSISDQPPAEEDLGGGDICSLEQEPSTVDDCPLP